MKKLLVLLSIFIITGCGDGYVSISQCSTRGDFYVCSNKCTKTSLEVKFLIDKSNGNVMQTYRNIENSDVSSRVKSSCKIFDNKNWDCSDELIGDAKHMMQSVDKMSNGKYASYFRNIRGGIDETNDFYCSK